MNGFPPGSPGGGGPPGYGMPPPMNANAAMGQQPQGATQPLAHYCFSGSLWCSGCNPCDACVAAVRQYVLIPALLAEQDALGQDLAVAQAMGRGVDLQLLANTFFKVAADAWRQLHATMQSMPAQNRPFRVMNVTKVMEAAEIGRQVIAERERAAQAAASAAAPANPGVPNAPAGSNVPMPMPMPPQNMAQPAPAAAAPPAPPPFIASKPVNFDEAIRAGGDVPRIITVHAEEPSPGGSSTGNGAPAARAVTADDFRAAAPSANGAETKAPS